MKKIFTLVLTACSFFLFSQTLISFEAAEGYSVGNIDGQNGWTTTGTGPGNPNIANQLVSAEDHVGTGTNSLKITKEVAFPGQANPIVGAFKDIGSSIPYDNFVLSFDIKITEQTATSSLFEFQTVGTAPTGGVYVIRLRFTTTGTILAAQTTGTTSTFATTTGTWSPNVWYRVRIVGTATGLTYYLNNTQIYSGNFFQNYPFTSMRFVHDNNSGSAYIDRIAINNESALAVSDVSNRDAHFSIYPNPVTDILKISSASKIKSVSVFDASGRNVKTQGSQSEVDVRELPSGTYMLKVETSGGTQTGKFIKK